jgi:hypothetical protein
MRSALLAVLVVVLVGCGEDEASDGEQVLAVMEEARAALVAGDGDTACALLTEAGRERAVAFDELSTCEETVRAARRSDPSSVEDAEKARFAEPVVDGDRASVDIDVEEYVTINVRLLRTGDGWRIDDSEAVPYGD